MTITSNISGTYEQKLTQLVLTSLEVHRQRGDMVLGRNDDDRENQGGLQAVVQAVLSQTGCRQHQGKKMLLEC